MQNTVPLISSWAEGLFYVSDAHRAEGLWSGAVPVKPLVHLNQLGYLSEIPGHTPRSFKFISLKWGLGA